MARLTIDMAPELHARLKTVAVKRRTTMRDYCVAAIQQRLAEEPTEYLSAETDPVLAELWDNDDDAVYDNL